MTRYSHNLVTWGLGVDSTIKAEKMRWMGSIRYDVGILMAIMANNRRTASLYLDGHKMEDDFTLFLIQNSQTGGSLLPLAPGASLDDGLMDIGILKKMTRRDILKAFGLLKKEGGATLSSLKRNHIHLEENGGGQHPRSTPSRKKSGPPSHR